MPPLRWAKGARPGQPYWWDGAGAADEAPHPLPERADLLIIGAGYTGLSGAIAAHDAGASVVVVDAGTPGQGASTRNGGMFGAHPRLGWDALARTYGSDVADDLFAEAGPAMDWVKTLITQEGIDCSLQQTGRIQLAWTPAHFDAQQRMAKVVQAKSDVAIQVIGRDGLADHIRTAQYFGGILFPQHCAINPRQFHDGLMAAVCSDAAFLSSSIAPLRRWNARTAVCGR